MSVTVRFKDCADFPCPLRTKGFTEEAWAAARGKSVILLYTVPASKVTSPCGSDTYWHVAIEGGVKDALAVSGRDGPMCLCRHVLEIGD